MGEATEASTKPEENGAAVSVQAIHEDIVKVRDTANKALAAIEEAEAKVDAKLKELNNRLSALENAPADSKGNSKKADPKREQAIRDAHFYENGVKADGTGGVPPESE